MSWADGNPTAAGRLAEAAFALYSERGFDETTVAEIAERAGLTERTFFRHFADKREVLFAGSSALQDAMAAAVVDAPKEQRRSMRSPPDSTPRPPSSRIERSRRSAKRSSTPTPSFRSAS